MTCSPSILSILLLALVIPTACSKAEKRPEKKSVAPPSPTEVAHQKGLEHASEMVRNAAMCEPPSAKGSVDACQLACKLNHSNSCANWGFFVEESDPELSAQLFRRACQGGSGIGCEAEAVRATTLDEELRSPMYLNARRYHRVHCAQGYARSCSELAHLLEVGLGGTVDADTGLSYRKQACLLGRSSDC